MAVTAKREVVGENEDMFSKQEIIYYRPYVYMCFIKSTQEYLAMSE